MASGIRSGREASSRNSGEALIEIALRASSRPAACAFSSSDGRASLTRHKIPQAEIDELENH